MRLLNVQTLHFGEFPDRNAVPPYAIASHRWCGEEEVTYQDVQDGSRTSSQGYLKVKAFADYVTRNFPSIEWLWIDTCCINKQDRDELQRSLISMFDWYRESEVCLAWLQDVESSTFAESIWWTRGWTLQELIAPRTVIFLSKTWRVIGSKGVASHDLKYAGQPELDLHRFGATKVVLPPIQEFSAPHLATLPFQPRQAVGNESLADYWHTYAEDAGPSFDQVVAIKPVLPSIHELLAPQTTTSLPWTWQKKGSKGGTDAEHKYAAQAGTNLEQEIAGRTGIPVRVIHDFEQSRDMSIEERLSWMNGRTTTVEEDMTYALFGILDVFMPALYGERDSRAKRRLRDAVQQASDRTRMLLGWISAPNPFVDHEAARLQHEPGTGAWLIRHPIYLAWKLGISNNLLWMRGKPGCGKSVLCFIAIENIADYCRALPNAAQAIFYCSFRDESKRTYNGLISSLLEQIAWKSPGPSLLEEAYSRQGARPLESPEKQQILLQCLKSFDIVFLHIDGLDECRAHGDDRLSVPQRLRELVSKATNLRVMVTSRNIPEIGHHIGELGAEVVVVEDNAVDLDIQQYVSNQIRAHWKLNNLDRPTKTLIEDTLASSAKGMFLWAKLQFQVLQSLGTTKKSTIEKALSEMPKTLDATYIRILENIPDAAQDVAFTLLRWIAYAKRPLSLAELVDTTIITLDGVNGELGATVDRGDRGQWNDALDLLAGLIVINQPSEYASRRQPVFAVPHHHSQAEDVNLYQPQETSVVSLTHFSLQEYLESVRMQTTSVKTYGLHPERDHGFIAQSCLAYIKHIFQHLHRYWPSAHLQIYREYARSKMIPLSRYALESWPYHSKRQKRNTCHREVALLTTEKYFSLLHKLYRSEGIDWMWVSYAENQPPHPLEIASFLALDNVVEKVFVMDGNLSKDTKLMSNVLDITVTWRHAEVFKVLYDHCARRKQWISEAARQAAIEHRAEILRFLLAACEANPLCEADYQHAMTMSDLQDPERTFELLCAAGTKMDARTGHPRHKILAYVLLDDAMSLKLHLNDVVDPAAHGEAFDQAVRSRKAALLGLLLDRGIGLERVDDALIEICAWSRGKDVDGLKACILMLLHHGASNYHAALTYLSHNREVELLKWMIWVCIRDIDKAITSMLEHRDITRFAHRVNDTRFMRLLWGGEVEHLRAQARRPPGERLDERVKWIKRIERDDIPHRYPLKTSWRRRINDQHAANGKTATNAPFRSLSSSRPQ